ncbi:MAG: hypothetical protein ACFNUC_07575, partial [Selenomonas noxia]
MREIEFHALTKEDKPLLDRYFRANYYENSHFNFTNLYMWRELGIPYSLEGVKPPTADRVKNAKELMDT